MNCASDYNLHLFIEILTRWTACRLY